MLHLQTRFHTRCPCETPHIRAAEHRDRNTCFWCMQCNTAHCKLCYHPHEKQGHMMFQVYRYRYEDVVSVEQAYACFGVERMQTYQLNKHTVVRLRKRVPSEAVPTGCSCKEKIDGTFLFCSVFCAMEGAPSRSRPRSPRTPRQPSIQRAWMKPPGWSRIRVRVRKHGTPQRSPTG